MLRRGVWLGVFAHFGVLSGPYLEERARTDGETDSEQLESLIVLRRAITTLAENK